MTKGRIQEQQFCKRYQQLYILAGFSLGTKNVLRVFLADSIFERSQVIHRNKNKRVIL